MADVASYVLSNMIVFVIQLVIFLLCIRIFTKTKGASLAYKNWAIATFFLLFSSIIHITAGVAFGLDEYTSTNANEFQKLSSELITFFGYIYLPIGVLYLSKDMNVKNINEPYVEKTRTLIYIIGCSIFVFFLTLIPFFEIRKITASVYVSLYLSVWIYTFKIYRPLYPHLSTLTNNSCWKYIYIAIFAAMSDAIFLLISFLYSESVVPIILLSRFIMAVGFIFGFFKLARMLDAI